MLEAYGLMDLEDAEQLAREDRLDTLEKFESWKARSTFLTADNVEIQPETDKVYFYPSWATDKSPCYGLMIFDHDDMGWQGYHGRTSGPIFATREGVDHYIELRHRKA